MHGVADRKRALPELHAEMKTPKIRESSGAIQHNTSAHWCPDHCRQFDAILVLPCNNHWFTVLLNRSRYIRTNQAGIIRTWRNIREDERVVSGNRRLKRLASGLCRERNRCGAWCSCCRRHLDTTTNSGAGDRRRIDTSQR